MNCPEDIAQVPLPSNLPEPSFDFMRGFFWANWYLVMAYERAAFAQHVNEPFVRDLVEVATHMKREVTIKPSSEWPGYVLVHVGPSV